MDSTSPASCDQKPLTNNKDCIFKNPFIMVIFCPIYAIIFFQGSFCCLLVCKKFWLLKKQSLWRRKLFYFNLILTDLLLILVNTIIGVFNGIYGTSGSIGCKFNTYLLNISLQVGALALSAITYNRYRIVSKYFHPNTLRCSHSMGQERHYFHRIESRILIILTWIMVMFYNVIYLVFSTNIRGLKYNLTNKMDGCDEVWPSLSIMIGFYGLQIALFFVSPMLFFMFCYAKIFLKFLQFRSATAAVIGSFNIWFTHHKLAKFDLNIVLLYFITKSPYYIWVIIHSVFIPLPYWSKLMVIIFATLGSCINSILYLLVDC